MLSLLFSRLYHNTELVNRQHRRILYSIKTVKHNYVSSVFVNQRLVYNNMDYYLDDQIKKRVVEDDTPTLE